MVWKLEVAPKGSALNREYLLGIRMPQTLLIYGRIHHFSWDNWDNSLFLLGRGFKAIALVAAIPRGSGEDYEPCDVNIANHLGGCDIIMHMPSVTNGRAKDLGI